MPVSNTQNNKFEDKKADVKTDAKENKKEDTKSQNKENKAKDNKSSNVSEQAVERIKAMLEAVEVPEGYKAIIVETGLSDESFIEIKRGLSEGDKVLLPDVTQGSGNNMFGGMSGMGGRMPGMSGMGGGMPAMGGMDGNRSFGGSNNRTGSTNRTSSSSNRSFGSR